MNHTITLIAGDGIGPEVTEAVVTILERAGLQVDWERHAAGVPALEQHGDTLPKELLDSIRGNKGRRALPPQCATGRRAVPGHPL